MPEPRIEPLTDSPILGLATTDEMLRELIARFTVNARGTHTLLIDVRRIATLAELLGGLSAPEREYRTVGGG
jgi:hypothetical protein